jgi:hypothetical protein
MTKLIYIPLFLFLLSCSGEQGVPEHSIYEIREVGQLATTEYTIGKIVKLDDTQYDMEKWGERKILIKTRAKVKAGVDLSKIKDSDIKVKGKTIEIKLPEAEVTTFSMDPDYTYTEMESVTGFRDNFTQTEKNKFLKQGEESIKKELNNTGILKEAEKNAEEFIKNFYSQQGFEKVVVKRASKL